MELVSPIEISKTGQERESTMDIQQFHALSLRKTDVEGAIRRLSGRTEIYVLCLKEFLGDSTIKELNNAIKSESWDEAFTAAHALKGVAGNLGFVPLMHAVGKLVILIRGGRTKEVEETLEQVNSSYRDIVDGICQYFALNKETKEKQYENREK